MTEPAQPPAQLPAQLSDSLALLEKAISDACRAADRPRSEVELLAISKTHPAQTLVEAVSLGLHLFGESRVQEFASKATVLSVSHIPGFTPTVRSQMEVHFIGQLQSNKATKAVEVFDAIDSVDSLRLAERLNTAVSDSVVHTKPLPILLEIKLSHEASKTGLTPGSTELNELLDRLPTLRHLELQGLMTIAPLDVPEEETRACFRALHTLRGQLAQQHPRLNFPVLSMGMSSDFPIAIAEGATRIRVGTALFGPREKN
jgi:PLP dependent protein